MPPRRPALSRATAIAVVATTLAGASMAAAQAPGARRWNDSATLDLVNRAVARRTAQLADTGLTDYRAIAHGFLTFLAQVGDGFPDPPQVVRADELAVEVYWRAPNQSKQRVVGRRDTLLLPTDIAYHRDHLVVVQNNFPAIIRLGDGDEVRDVPHPLSARGREAYDFAAGDSLTIRVAARQWHVTTVDVRPRDERQPRVIGSLYIDRETASVVRVALSFTRAALIDPALEDVAVVLDNGLVDGRFWLPRRQEIEIRRSGSWLDFPARGIIRGEWDLCCVETNGGVPPDLFRGPEIVIAPPAALRAWPFPGRLVDSIAARVDAAGPGRPAELVQRRAAELVGAAALGRASRASFGARSASDFVRVNRVEGLAVGAGASVRLPGALTLRGDGRYGRDDRLLKHRLMLSGRLPHGIRLAAAAFDEYRDASDVPEMSSLGNSIASQELGLDFTDLFRTTGLGMSADGGNAVRWTVGLEQVREGALDVHATPYSGAYRPALAADPQTLVRARIEASAARLALPAGATLRVAGAAWWHSPRSQDGAPTPPRPAYTRVSLHSTASRPAFGGDLSLSALAAGTFSGTPPRQASVLFGGPTTAPGYAAHALSGDRGLTARLEWARRVASFVVPLGRFGATRVPVILAPYVNSAWARDTAGAAAPRRSVGLGVRTLHDLIRLDVARGVDAGGRWTVYLDFGRPFWRIL